MCIVYMIELVEKSMVHVKEMVQLWDEENQ